MLHLRFILILSFREPVSSLCWVSRCLDVTAASSRHFLMAVNYFPSALPLKPFSSHLTASPNTQHGRVMFLGRRRRRRWCCDGEHTTRRKIPLPLCQHFILVVQPFLPDLVVTFNCVTWPTNQETESGPLPGLNSCNQLYHWFSLLITLMIILIIDY